MIKLVQFHFGNTIQQSSITAFTDFTYTCKVLSVLAAFSSLAVSSLLSSVL